jgi:hypothetical protein
MKQVQKMMDRLRSSAFDILSASKQALKSTNVQMILGGILILYIAFLESETESILTLAMSNPLGRILVLLLLVILTYANPVLGALFVILIIMSFVSVGVVSTPQTIPEGFEDGVIGGSDGRAPGDSSPAPAPTTEEDIGDVTKAFYADDSGTYGRGFQDGVMGGVDTPADGLKEEEEDKKEGFISGGSLGKKEYSLFMA